MQNTLLKFGLAVIALLGLVACQANGLLSDDLTVSKLQKKGTLVVGTAITSPFEFHDPQTNQLVGFDVDLMTHIANELGVTIEWVEMPFASLLPKLQNRDVDLVIAAMYIKPEREEVVNFSRAYMETGLVMAARPQLAAKLSGTDDLAGLRMGVKTGATGDKLAQELQIQGVNLQRVEFTDTAASLVALEGGGVDVVLNDYLNTLIYLKDTGSNMTIVSGEDGGPLFLSNVGLGIAFHEDDTQLLNRINQILTDMRADGSYRAILETWFPQTTP